MDFITLVEKVQEIVKRPDKDALIKNFINEAIREFVLTGSFAEDILEETLAIDPLSYGGTLDISDLTRFRRIFYLRPEGQGLTLVKTNPEDMIRCNGAAANRYFVAGNAITFTLSSTASNMLIAYYTYPATMQLDESTHWLSTACPYAVINKAAGMLFSAIGDDTSANTYLALAQNSFNIFMRDKYQA
jgi:hypothetical protein